MSKYVSEIPNYDYYACIAQTREKLLGYTSIVKVKLLVRSW